MMKNRKSSAKIGSQCKILGQQAEKLKEKLQNLKQQIKLKKQEKKMSSTATSLGSFNKQTKAMQKKQQRLNTTQYTQKPNNQLLEVLNELKIQNILSKLQEKSVKKLQQLLSLDEEQIDKWKDIPIGYRIKLKKYIEKQKSKVKVSQLKVVQVDSEIKKQKNNNSIKDIEQIIKSRKAGQIFIPIDRKSQEVEQRQFVKELQESEQQQMMRSIMLVLGAKNRKGCFKKPNANNKEKKQVQWNKSVDQMQKQHVQTKYPKQKINKQIFHQLSLPTEINSKEQLSNPSLSSSNEVKSTLSGIPNYKYCWICLKMVKQNKYSQQQRQFCSFKCLQAYQQQVNQPQFFVQIVKVQEKYNQYKQKEIVGQFSEEDELSFDII